MVCWVDLFQRFGRKHAFWILLLSYVLFTLFGGLVLMAIEQPQENGLRAQVVELREHFLRDNYCVPESRLDTIIVKASFSANRNIALLDAHRNDWSWDFISSMFFVINVLTLRGKKNK